MTSLSVIDLTREVSDGRETPRASGGLEIVVVHRIWRSDETPLDADVTAVELCELLMHAPETGGQLAYAVLIDREGTPRGGTRSPSGLPSWGIRGARRRRGRSTRRSSTCAPS